MGTEFEEIKNGLLEAIEHAEGRAPKTCISRPHAIDVKSVRTKIGMTQEQFAARFGFSTATLRHWERGDRALTVLLWYYLMLSSTTRKQL